MNEQYNDTANLVCDTLRAAFIRRLTVDSETHDRRRRDFNQALFDADEGFACFNDIDLDMILQKFDAAVLDITTKRKDARIL